MVRCARCHRVITDPAAIEAGYGAKCYAKEFGKKLKSPARPRKGKIATQPKSTAERQIIGQLTVYDILAAHEKKHRPERPVRYKWIETRTFRWRLMQEHQAGKYRSPPHTAIL